MPQGLFAPVTEGPVSYPRELLASVVVFLVALPLCMGIAIASGVPPALGLVTGIVGGLVVGAFSGSPLLVSGPAAGLSVLVWQAVQDFGPERLGLIVLGVGVIQLVCGVSKLGRWFRAVSPAVIYGMLAGIGILIFASQFHVMVDDVPRDQGWKNLISIPEAVGKGLSPRAGAPMHHLAATIGLLTLLVLLGWNMWRPQFLRAVPGPLVAVVVATAVQAVLGWDIQHVTIPEYVGDALHLFTFSDLAGFVDLKLVGECLAFAAIASAETLLSAVAVDRLHGGKRSDFDRELTAQGLGNALCGLLGALPMTGVIVRSTANVESGARTRLSTMLHGLWLLALVFGFPSVLRMIPVASLAAILVYTGCKLVDVRAIRGLYRIGLGELVVYLITASAIVATDLLMGVVAGIVAALIKLLWHFARLDVVIERDLHERRAEVRLFGAATFVQLPKLADSLEGLERDLEVHIDLTHVAYIDQGSLDLLRAFERAHCAGGGTVSIDWNNSAARNSGRSLAHAAKNDHRPSA